MPGILKHLITLQCDRSCWYCVNQYMQDRHTVTYQYLSFLDAYKELGRVFPHIAITGGEPTMLGLKPYLVAASQFFSHRSLWTNNYAVVREDYAWIQPFVNDVMLGIHTSDLEDIPYVELDIPVYGSVVQDNYHERFPLELKKRGFSGLTIRRRFPDGLRYPYLIPSYANFPIRYRGEGEVFGGRALMPNLDYVMLKC